MIFNGNPDGYRENSHVPIAIGINHAPLCIGFIHGRFILFLKYERILALKPNKETKKC